MQKSIYNYGSVILHYLQKIYFPLFFIMAILIYMMQYSDIPLPLIINNHVNDFFCIPIVLFICQYVIRYVKSNRQLLMPVPLLLVITSMYCIYFEYYLPKSNKRYTADSIDIVMYFLGLFYFYVMEYITIKKTIRS